MNFSFANFIFSTKIFAGVPLMDYFMQSNFAGQVIVVILVIFSVLAWGVMLCKYLDLKAVRDENTNTYQCVLKSSSLLEVASIKSVKGPFASILRDAVRVWAQAGMGVNENAQTKAARISLVENAIQRSVSRQMVKYQEKMTVLGTIISGAPFLGLLGTAWGVMDCFGSMSGQASVTLQNLAPGVAGALLTTVAGLVVAIPSVFGYNFLTAMSTAMMVELENFASSIADKIEAASTFKDVEVQKNNTEQPQQKTFIKETVVQQPNESKVIKFSLDEDDETARPTPFRDFED